VLSPFYTQPFAFLCAIDTSSSYIQEQEQHHAKTTFRQEYIRFLKRYEIDHDERFIFKPAD